MCLEIELALMELDKSRCSHKRNNMPTIVYVIKILVLELGKYKAYRVIPAPKFVQENLFAYISTPDDYIITNDGKLLYIPTEENFLKGCKTHRNNYFCKSIFPKYYIKSHEACMSKVMNEPLKLEGNDCNIKMVSMTHTMWIQFKSNDRWLYATASPETIKIICNNSVEEKMIEGTKILQRKAIRSPKGNIRKSRIRISEWAISSENPDCIIV
ncbi:hypothetical protein PV328_001005 [Microctonus aethiopoides]|uniref:Uncharacterized protein n=1 Tax=Microctonus aethiopoides TaxID=144406 RepID=A0AA39KX45_9HYME|nr:hypothetical protein PV328_001005 [Microctonus aethiopoides]